MVFTAGQTATFLEDASHLHIPRATVEQLEHEGLLTIGDVAEFTEETIKQVAANLRRPGGRIPDPTPGAAAGATIPTPPFVLDAKSQERFIATANLLRYYDTVGREATLSNTTWATVAKNFQTQWKSMESKKKGEQPEIPKITKALLIIRWTEVFSDFLHRCIGDRMIPLSYVIRPDVVPPTIGALATDCPHSIEHGSIEDKMVARATHTHPTYRDDNKKVYFLLEESTRTTDISATVKTFSRSKNGRGAWLAVKNQFAGRDKWEKEITNNEQILHTRKWTGQSQFALENFVSMHRMAYVSLVAAAEHVTYQLPNEHSRVGYLLAGIENGDAGLAAAIASIKTDQTPTGLRNNFESAAAHIMPYDPVLMRRAAKHAAKRNAANISETSGANVSSFGAKKGTGKTGVALMWHTSSDFAKLPLEQKNELRAWSKKNASEGGTKQHGKCTGKNAKKKLRYNQAANEKAIAAAVKSQVAAKLEELESSKQGNEDNNAAYIMSLIEAAATKGGTAKKKLKSIASAEAITVDDSDNDDTKTPAVTLKEIIKPVRILKKIPRKVATVKQKTNLEALQSFMDKLKATQEAGTEPEIKKSAKKPKLPKSAAKTD